ncbi:hypothetical protein FDP41_013489 [Naegleria fowleri]|uniref:non-specific serine/threonine protein kinase n=1 Tax=Naegleria fowleri TaxID=5763 RepID=A0A6A5C458_NAEFO|nr:uncharacterized protein FDP41_013489 [Naegleria fowleri]KAF0980275.1 hypothetical protein FDP41_013489 [Naegleria fowleri]
MMSDSSEKKSKKKKDKKDKVKTIGNKYRLGETLGRGGFGVVYKAYNMDTGEFVAVKRITVKKCSKEQIETIHTEINLLKKLKHNRIVRYIDHIPSKSKLYIVIEFVETGSLLDIVQKYGNMKENVVCKYVAQVLEGLQYLHSEGVIHRDIKGANILTTKEGDIKLADFGVAATLADVDDNPVGTPYWNAMPALYRIVQDPHPPLPSGISSECEDFLMECFKKHPGSRKTAEQLLQHPWILQAKKNAQTQNKPSANNDKEGEKKTTQLKKYNEDEEEDDFDFGEDDDGLALKIGDKLKSPVKDDPFGDSDEEDKNPFSNVVNIRPENKEKFFPNQSFFGGPTTKKNLALYKEDDDEDGVWDEDEEWDNDKNDKGEDLFAKMQKLQGRPVDEIGDDDPFFQDTFEDAFDDMDKNSDDELMKPEKDFNALLERFQQDGLTEDLFVAQCEKIILLLSEFARLKCRVKSLVPIPFVELISMSQQYTPSFKTIEAALKLINQFIADDDIAWVQENVHFKETLCLVGILPNIMQFCHKNYPYAVRYQAGSFIRSIFKTSHFTVRMFIGCQGIRVLVDLLAHDNDALESGLALVFETIENIEQVFDLPQEAIKTPKNDFCRLFAKNGLMLRLSEVLLLLVRKFTASMEDKTIKKYLDKTISLLLLFSSMDSVVRAHIAEVASLKRILEAFSILNINQDAQRKFKLTMAIITKNLATYPVTFESFEKADGIPVLVKTLALRDADIGNQMITALLHLTRFNKKRQIIAVEAGIVPEIQYLISNDSILKTFAVDMLCEIVRVNVPSVRKELKEHKMLEFYINVLGVQNWQLKAMESLSKWLNEDKEGVETVLAKPENINKLVEMFCSAPSRFVSSPLLSIISTSVKLSKALSQSHEFITKVVKHALLQPHSDKKVRSDQLKIVQSLYKWCDNPKVMTTELYSVIFRIRETESSILIKDLADDLISAFELNLKV